MKLFRYRKPSLNQLLGVTMVATYYPGRQALLHSDPIERTRRAAGRVAAWAEADAMLTIGRVEENS